MTNVAILGFGVVGSGTAEVLTRSQTRTNHRKQDIQLKYILDLHDRADSPYADKFVKDFSIIESDPDCHIVVEAIGGVGAAYEMTKKALQAGKSVVSSNKELVATHGYELLELAKANQVNYLFEASVGGGIPVLRPLVNCLAGNGIEEVAGILNGTTNYILTRMIEDKITFDTALKQAQELGFAEKDPTADIEGHDACRKICILGNLSYGNQIDPNAVSCQGISAITETDINYATALDCRVKLLGRVREEEDKRISIFVAPHLVYQEHPLAAVTDVFNAVTIKGDSVDETMFYGKGAGALPTASAVVGDVIDLSKDLHSFRGNDWGNDAVTLVPAEDILTPYFVRFQFKTEQTGSSTSKMEQVERYLAESGYGEQFFPLYASCEGNEEEEMAFITMYPTTKGTIQTALNDYKILTLLPVYGFPPVDSIDLEETEST